MDGYRSGFACFVGRPNAGKSTLTNALVGTKVAITSSKPQTTRHTIRGIVHREDGQLVLVDLGSYLKDHASVPRGQGWTDAAVRGAGFRMVYGILPCQILTATKPTVVHEAAQAV